MKQSNQKPLFIVSRSRASSRGSFTCGSDEEGFLRPMKRTQDGSFRIDPAPEIEVYVNAGCNIVIEIDNEIVVIPRAFAKAVARAIATLAREIKAGEYGNSDLETNTEGHENPNDQA